MTTPQIIKTHGYVFGADVGFSEQDPIRWSLVIKTPRVAYHLMQPATLETLAQSITHVIKSNLPHLIVIPSKSETGVKSGKYCPTCGGTNVHEPKCPNQELRLRGFKK